MGLTNRQIIPERPNEKIPFSTTVSKSIQQVKSIFNRKEPFTSLAVLSVILTGIGEVIGRSFSVAWYILVGLLVIGSFYIIIRRVCEKE